MEKDSSNIDQILDVLEQLYPDAGTELHFHSVFELLVAVVLSAQCTDKRVNMVTENLFRCCPGPEQLAAMPVEEIEGLIQSVGLYRSKAKNIKAFVTML